MSDTETLDNGATDSVASNPVAPPSQAGDTQGSTPAPADTAASETAKPEATEAEKQSRQASRAFATQRRENRELHRELGYMRAQLEAIRGANSQQPSDGEAPPQQRQTRSPSPQDDAQGELNRSILERIEDAGEEYEEVVEKITAASFPMTVAMRDYLATSDKPAELAKLLADDPKEARRISLLGDRAADRALERLEARVGAKPAPRTTKALPPVRTVGGSSTATDDPSKMSMDDYVAWRKRKS